MPTPQYEPKVPMPETTKKATKRKKYTKRPGMRKPNAIGLIYRTGTDCQVADEATEKRLSQYGPETSPRFGGYQIKW